MKKDKLKSSLEHKRQLKSLWLVITGRNSTKRIREDCKEAISMTDIIIA
jgi:hypothetical protein